ncbi:MAG: hypothetical protein PHG35_02220 [Dehalococcoidales bacterium]|nr:hypothetical protein [Dehalococcoidales bacterium]
MQYYKLTDWNYQTHGWTQWGENITHRAIGTGCNLCTNDVIHVYDHPLKAAFFNPAHASFNNPILWKCRVRKVVANDGTKVGVKECTTLKRLPLPEITINQRIRAAILAVLLVYKEDSYVTWANNWLSGKDRSAEAAGAAGAAARAAWAAGAAVGAAARAAARAAAGSAEAAGAAVGAAARAAGAAGAAARAAWAAEKDMDFVVLIQRAIKEEALIC